MSAIRTVCALLTVGKRFPAANVNCASHHPVIANIKNMYEEQNKAIKKKETASEKKNPGGLSCTLFSDPNCHLE